MIMVEESLENYFLTSSGDSFTRLEDLTREALNCIRDNIVNCDQPFSGIRGDEFRDELKNWISKAGETSTFGGLTEKVFQHGIQVNHPACAAHLHCPVLAPAVAAELLIAASNYSMDSWDQTGAATIIEDEIVKWLGQKIGYEECSSGVFTSGGTQSNLMGMLLARNHFFTQRGEDVGSQGLSGEKAYVVCNEHAHFSISQSLALLGLGRDAAVKVKSNSDFQMDLTELQNTYAKLKAEGCPVIAVVATAGTTDFGSIDPLLGIAEFCRDEDLWLHVDAAYGGGLLLSQSKHLLSGLQLADSITIDFHKLFFLPISCSTLMVKNSNLLESIHFFSNYLNRQEDQEEGVLNLVGRSIQTTRRFDAFKVWVCLQTPGEKLWGEAIDKVLKIGEHAAETIKSYYSFELVNRPVMNSVVFYLKDKALSLEEANLLHNKVRKALLAEGKVVLGQTEIAGRVCFKLTLMNPLCTEEDLENILEEVYQACLIQRFQSRD
ncbi:MAG: pyridoxal-dependent decarboxylase [Lentisphaerales bacterium]|nr:pyridoxal-dependent decarboxylase [Lentisphaerales bacterium]